MDCLPQDLLPEILIYLPSEKEIVRSRLVCKRWHRAGTSSRMMDLVQRQFYLLIEDDLQYQAYYNGPFAELKLAEKVEVLRIPALRRVPVRHLHNERVKDTKYKRLGCLSCGGSALCWTGCKLVGYAHGLSAMGMCLARMTLSMSGGCACLGGLALCYRGCHISLRVWPDQDVPPRKEEIPPLEYINNRLSQNPVYTKSEIMGWLRNDKITEAQAEVLLFYWPAFQHLVLSPRADVDQLRVDYLRELVRDYHAAAAPDPPPQLFMDADDDDIPLI